MLNSQSEINLLKQANKTALQAIISGLSAARPGMNAKDIEAIVRQILMHGVTQSVRTLVVQYGKIISPEVELLQEIQNGDFLSIRLSGWAKSYPFDLERVTVIGQPTTRQKDYLDHLIEATNWMIQAIGPDRIMTFYPAESRGRLITPIAYELDVEFKEISRINPREQFILPIGTVLCIAPAIKSPEFGTMTHSEMIVLTEKGVEILT